MPAPFPHLHRNPVGLNFALESAPNLEAPDQCAAGPLGPLPLRRIEERRRTTEELDVATPDRVHLEHIYPQNPTGGRDPGHNTIINRLGNLTLLSRRINQAIKNAPFDEKKAHYARSEIIITRSLTDYDEWNEESMDRRQRELAAVAGDIWNFDE